VVNDSDLGIAEDGREFVRLHGWVAVDRDWRVAGAPQLFSYRSEGVVGVYKNSPHGFLPSRPPALAA
jgi:hypothetical protein